MERRFLIFKTSGSGGELDVDFLEDLDRKYVNCVQTCSLGSDHISELVSSELYSCCVPDGWCRVANRQDIQNKITCNKIYNIQDEGLDLCDRLNTLLDPLDNPGRCLLTLVWVCDEPPLSPPPPYLHAILNRVVSWHAGQLLVLTSAEQCDQPSWLNHLNAKVVPSQTLCSCHGLEYLLPPTLVWRGSLSFFHPDSTSSHLQGFELHFDRDDLNWVIQQIDLRQTGAVKDKVECTGYYESSLELVCEVDPLFVPPLYLTDQHFKLCTTKTDELTHFIMEEGTTSPRLGYIARLRWGKELSKGFTKRNTSNWEKHIVEEKYDTADESYLEEPAEVLYFLLYAGSNSQKENCAPTALGKSAILLKNAHDLIDPRLQARNRISWQGTFHADVVASVDNLDLELKVPLQTQYEYKRDVVAKILKKLAEERKSEVQSRVAEDLVLAVDESIEKLWLRLDDFRTPTPCPVPQHTLLDLQTKHKPVYKYTEDMSEKLLLRLDALLQKQQEIFTLERDPNLVSRRGDTISLEAREIVKYFESSGEPANHLDLQPVITGSRCATSLSHSEYRKIFQENFKEISDRDQYPGFLFKGIDFSIVEHTKYHDVFYHTGLQAEIADKEFVRMRDVYVGISKETFTTLNKIPEKLKLKQKNAASTAVRRSPRKKLGKGVRTPVKPTRAVRSGGRYAVRPPPPPKPSVGAGGDNRKKQQTVQSDGDAEERRRKKLRVAVYQSLLENGVKEQDPLFRRCFTTLFKMCQILAVPNSGTSTSELLLDVAMSNVGNVIRAETMQLKHRRRQ